MRCTTRLLYAKYCITASELVGILKSRLSMSARIKAPLEKAFFTTYRPLVSRAKLSSMIKHGLVALLQD